MSIVKSLIHYDAKLRKWIIDNFKKSWKVIIIKQWRIKATTNQTRWTIDKREAHKYSAFEITTTLLNITQSTYLR